MVCSLTFARSIQPSNYGASIWQTERMAATGLNCLATLGQLQDGRQAARFFARFQAIMRTLLADVKVGCLQPSLGRLYC